MKLDNYTFIDGPRKYLSFVILVKAESELCNIACLIRCPKPHIPSWSKQRHDILSNMWVSQKKSPDKLLANLFCHLPPLITWFFVSLSSQNDQIFLTVNFPIIQVSTHFSQPWTWRFIYNTLLRENKWSPNISDLEDGAVTKLRKLKFSDSVTCEKNCLFIQRFVSWHKINFLCDS